VLFLNVINEERKKNSVGAVEQLILTDSPISSRVRKWHVAMYPGKFILNTTYYQ